MKAAQINEYGNADKIQVTEISEPNAGDGQVLVEVHAASLNPFDTMVREGYIQDMIPSLPITLGGDIAGVITEIGSGVTDFKVGDKIYGQAGAVAGNSGALAEKAVTKSSQIAIAPGNLDFEQASSLPLVGVSAWQALNEHIGLQSGQKIFIHGGSGGIGAIAVQIAKHNGAHVTTSVRGREAADAVKVLGADEVIDTENQSIEDLKDFDAAFDTVGGEEFAKIFGVLKQGGIAVSMLGQGLEAPTESGIQAISQSTHLTTDKLNALCELVESGHVKPNVGKVFPLNEIQVAFEARESGNVNGKIVIAIL